MRSLSKATLLVLGTVVYCAQANFFLNTLRALQTATTTDPTAPPPLAHSETLRCDECIRSGFNFCIQSVERKVLAPGEAEPARKCCLDATCSEATNVAWTCSSSFSDPVMARSVCPFKKSQCGGVPDILLNNTGEAVNVDVNLAGGEMCMFNMRAKCGMPAFKPEGTNLDCVDIQFVQFKDDVAEAPPTT